MQSLRELVLISLHGDLVGSALTNMPGIRPNGGREATVDIVVAYIVCVQRIRHMATGNALAIFHSEAEPQTPAPLPNLLETPAADDPVQTPGDRRPGTSEGMQSLNGELDALTVAVETLTLWTIGLTMLIAALACATLLRLG